MPPNEGGSARPPVERNWRVQVNVSRRQSIESVGYAGGLRPPPCGAELASSSKCESSTVHRVCRLFRKHSHIGSSNPASRSSGQELGITVHALLAGRALLNVGHEGEIRAVKQHTTTLMLNRRSTEAADALFGRLPNDEHSAQDTELLTLLRRVVSLSLRSSSVRHHDREILSYL